MNKNIKDIDTDILAATTKFAKKNVIYVTAAYFVNTMLSAGLLFLIFWAGEKLGSNFNIGFLDKLMNLRFESINLVDMSSTILIGLLIGLILLSFSAWFVNYSLIQINSYILMKDSPLSEHLSNSFSMKILKTIFILIVLSIITIVLYVSLSFVLIELPIPQLATIVLVFVSSIFIMAINLKLSLSIPIALFSDESAINSLIISFKKVSFKTALKYIGILFIVLIGIGVVFFFIVTMISSIISALGFIGSFLSIIFQFIVYGFLFALYFSFTLSLYYEILKPQIEDKLDLEDNIIL